jgi:hypothetical protein
MRKVYYILMQNSYIAIPLVITCALATTLQAQQPPALQDPVPQPAIPSRAAPQVSLRSASLESHEGVTISVLPWADAAKYKEKFPKESPYSAGILALQVSFRNESSDSIKVNLNRIRLAVQIDEDNRQELPSLTSEEVADTVFKPATKDPTARRTRIPIPVGAPKASRDKKWTELQTQAQNAAVPTTVIAPHSTVEGLLYFDLQKQFDLLQTSRLYVPELVLMQGNRALTYFEIDLSQQQTR